VERIGGGGRIDGMNYSETVTKREVQIKTPRHFCAVKGIPVCALCSEREKVDGGPCFFVIGAFRSKEDIKIEPPRTHGRSIS
jgi:hypothetical protein